MRRRLAIVGVVVAAWTAIGITVRATYATRTTADEPEYLMTAISLGEDRSLDVSDERLERRYRAFHDALLPVQTLRRSDGSRVSPHDPLLPAFLALPMRVGGWLAAKLTIAVLAGLLAAATLWVAVRRFNVPVATATSVVLAFALAPPLAVYGSQVYPESPAALAVVVAVGCLTGPLGRRGLAGVVAALVALPWLAVKYVPIAAVLGAALVVILWRRADRLDRRRLGWVVAVLVSSAVVYVVLHQAWYGGWTVYASGDHFVDGELTAVGSDPDLWGRSVRLVGLLVDRSFGLVPWQPLFVVVPFVVGGLVRRRPAGWPIIVATIGVGWLNATFVALTMHGYWWPGRQVVVVLPLVVLATACWAARSAGGRHLVWVCLAVGALNYAWVVVQGWVEQLTWVVDFDTTTAPFFRAVRWLLPDYRNMDAASWGVHAVCAIAAAASVVAAMLQRPNRHVLGCPNGPSKESRA
jgi:hypothetical protein